MPLPPVTYLDHAATTPMVPEAVAAMTAELTRLGNPSSLHGSGRRSRQVVEESRERVAAALGALPGEVVFTSGGTEADNLAVKGLFWARHAVDPRCRRVLISAVEHHAVLDAADWLGRTQGAHTEYLPVDPRARLRLDVTRDRLREGSSTVALVSVMWANNEVGTVQPVTEVVQAAAEHGIPVHTDAVQAVGQLPVDFAASGVDAMTVTGHKVGGPVGVGALLVRREARLVPVLHGGGQERDVRSGTLDAPAVAGFAAAVELAVREQSARAANMRLLRDELVRRVGREVPDARLNGDPALAGGRLPGNAHFTFAGCEGDALLLLLDAQGVECSTGSACSAGVARASHVLLAAGLDETSARGSLRFSLGHTSTIRDVDALTAVLGSVVDRARVAALAGARRGA